MWFGAEPMMPFGQRHLDEDIGLPGEAGAALG